MRKRKSGIEKAFRRRSRGIEKEFDWERKKRLYQKRARERAEAND